MKDKTNLVMFAQFSYLNPVVLSVDGHSTSRLPGKSTPSCQCSAFGGLRQDGEWMSRAIASYDFVEIYNTFAKTDLKRKQFLFPILDGTRLSRDVARVASSISRRRALMA